MKMSFIGSAVSLRRLLLWMMALAIVAATAFASAAGPASGAAPSGRAFGFGQNSDGQLGDGSLNSAKDPGSVINASDNPIENASVVKAGCYHGLALKKSGTVLAWGDNDSGQLGDGTTTDRDHAAPVPGLTDVKAISAGCYHNLALKEDGTVWAWGENFYGELGNGKDEADYAPDDPQELEPIQVDNLTNVKNISAGYYHSMAVKQNGTPWTWGYGGYGQIGNGNLDDSKVPERVQSLTNVRSVSTSAYGEHSLALREDGTAWAWGENEYGQLGNGKDEDDYIGDAVELEPVQVDNLTNVKGISAGYDFSLAMKNAGTVFSWGDNEYNQLGDGTTTDKNVPERIEGLTNVKRISAGTYHSLALRENGAPFGWGYNQYGEVGNGKNLDDDYTPDAPQEPEPVRVGLTNIKSISAGYYASLASKN